MHDGSRPVETQGQGFALQDGGGRRRGIRRRPVLLRHHCSVVPFADRKSERGGANRNEAGRRDSRSAAAWARGQTNSVLKLVAADVPSHTMTAHVYDPQIGRDPGWKGVARREIAARAYEANGAVDQQHFPGVGLRDPRGSARERRTGDRGETMFKGSIWPGLEIER